MGRFAKRMSRWDSGGGSGCTETVLNGRDVAIMRAKFANATVLLGSATPSLESYTNAIKGKYILSTLKKRATAAQLPTIHIVDMQREFARNGGYTLFSEALIDGMKKVKRTVMMIRENESKKAG